jgi:hypothetical protein
VSKSRRERIRKSKAEDVFFKYDNSSLIIGMQKEGEESESESDKSEKKKRKRDSDVKGNSKNTLNETDFRNADDGEVGSANCSKNKTTKDRKRRRMMLDDSDEDNGDSTNQAAPHIGGAGQQAAPHIGGAGQQAAPHIGGAGQQAALHIGSAGQQAAPHIGGAGQGAEPGVGGGAGAADAALGGDGEGASSSFSFFASGSSVDLDIERARLSDLIEKSKQYLENKTVSAQEYVEIDNGLPVMNAQTDEEIVRDVVMRWETRSLEGKATKKAGVGVRRKDTESEKEDEKTEEESKIEREHEGEGLTSKSDENINRGNDGLPANFKQAVREAVQEVLMEVRKRKSQPNIPAGQKTIDSFFKKRK